jgi:hypothetical protein
MASQIVRAGKSTGLELEPGRASITFAPAGTLTSLAGPMALILPASTRIDRSRTTS